jgi:hypothetical protein
MADRPAPAVPVRLVQWLAMWDYIVEVLTERLRGLTDEEFLWEPADRVWTVRPNPTGGRSVVDEEVWPPTGDPAPARTIAWSVGHLGAGVARRADWLVGTHSKRHRDYDWPLTADAGVAFMLDGLRQWRDGIATMTDADLDTVGRSSAPGGLDRTLPLIDIVWWVTKEVTWHAAEIWYVRDLYASRVRG